MRVVAHCIFTPTDDGDLDLRQTILPFLLDLRRREAGLPMEELAQTPGNPTAFTGVFLEQVRARRLRVYRGPDLRQLVLNAVMVETTRGLRLAKKKRSRRGYLLPWAK